MPIRKLKQYLDERDIRYVILRHPSAYTAQEVAANAHIPGKMVAKTVMVKIDGKMSMAILPASYVIDFKKLKMYLGCSSLELAREEEFRNIFPQCEVGAMPPFGNLYHLDVYVAESLSEDEDIVFCAGTHSELVMMSFMDYFLCVKPKLIRFSQKCYV